MGLANCNHTLVTAATPTPSLRLAGLHLRTRHARHARTSHFVCGIEQRAQRRNPRPSKTTHRMLLLPVSTPETRHIRRLLSPLPVCPQHPYPPPVALRQPPLLPRPSPGSSLHLESFHASTPIAPHSNPRDPLLQPSPPYPPDNRCAVHPLSSPTRPRPCHESRKSALGKHSPGGQRSSDYNARTFTAHRSPSFY